MTPKKTGKKPGKPESNNTLAENKPDDDVIQPFQLETSHLRGRVVRLGPALDDILGPHNYPEPVARLTAETVTLTALLSSMLKYEGIFTLQTKGDGPVGMLVADMTSAGDIRGCANFDAGRVDKMFKGSDDVDREAFLTRYLGKGHIAFTVDPGVNADRYQGIVDLKGVSLVNCVQHYFAQSEQIGAGIKLAVSHVGGHWRAGAIMIQRMPEEGGNVDSAAAARKAANDEKHNRISSHEDDWRRSMALLDTCTDQELLSPQLHSNALLFRLFHEEGVRVFDPVPVKKGCRCDAEKVKAMLAMMSKDDRAFMAKDGKIQARCEFCSRDFEFDLAEIEDTKE